ncbi:hypothetical protein [Mycobacterium sp. WUMAC-067]|uniref:hypothetical protein n=2 Tax=unclassified Mycobacterium TaxID=2642494 RepID=UPI0035A87B7C
MGMAAALHDTLDDLASGSRCRVVILTGAGRGFCPGLDLSENPRGSDRERPRRCGGHAAHP